MGGGMRRVDNYGCKKTTITVAEEVGTDTCDEMSL